MSANLLCNHYHSIDRVGLSYRDNRLNREHDFTCDALATYLNCRQCAVLTPTIGYKIPGALSALVKLVGYSILRPFAYLVGFFIHDEVATMNHPKLAMFARVLTIPRMYSKIEWRCLKGFMYHIFGNSYGQALIIETQFTKKSIQKCIYTKNFSEIKELMDPRGGWYDAQRDNYRLVQLRYGDPFSSFGLRLFKSDYMNFQKLIDEGYLVPKK